MVSMTQHPARDSSSPPLRPRAPIFLQRKCACGGTPGPSGECEECRKRRLEGSPQEPGTTLQPKLRIGAPDDRFEREADQVAERVTAGPSGGPVSVQPVGSGAVHRAAHPQATGGGAATSNAPSPGVPQAVHGALASGGHPLPDSTREHFEGRFGHDFRQVRIHTDGRAAAGAAAISARAFTSGSSIVFGAGQFAPDSPAGQKLLAHELTHVLQQRSGVVQRAGLIQRACEKGETEYKVKKKDSLWKIARDHGSTVDAIKERNGLESDTIHPGQMLCIPAKKAKEPEKDTPKKDTPKKDESKKEPPKKDESKKEPPKKDESKKEPPKKDESEKDAPKKDEGKKDTPKKDESKKAAGSGTSKCSITVPSDTDTQRLAGVIFAEAAAKPTGNEERRAIGWSFLNAVSTTTGVCNSTLCPNLKTKQRTRLCADYKKHLGETVLDAIKAGSAAYGNKRWKMVMKSDSLRSSSELCKLVPGEKAAIERAIKAAIDVKAGTGKVSYVRFNRAKDKPPSFRFVKSKSIEGHTFYSFKKKDSEGRCLF